ncbi:hypothetical protein PAPHI01_2133 [Pancytospora philotis]|nr:hypothetical protein PAPHI01_2133 [Pancytospora philotis]
MDQDVAHELETIMRMDDHGDCQKSTARLLHYISTLAQIEPRYVQTLQRFVNHAFAVLPASSLPAAVAQKFGLAVNRRRRVSFGEAAVFEIRTSGLSAEGERQRLREESSLRLVNTDPARKFRPKPFFENGVAGTTAMVPLCNMNVDNGWKGCTARSTFKIPPRALSIDKIIANPKLLDMYK